MILDNVPVNLFVDAGTDFSRSFYLTNYDKSPRDITGGTVSARMAQHPTALIAHLSTSEEVVPNFINLNASVVDGAGGHYSISIPADESGKLREGKYSYSVVMELDGKTEKLVDGLIFVDVAFASF